MTSKIVVNNIEADAGISTVTFGSNISGNFVGSISVSGVTTVSAGSTSAPSISPSGDNNTGIFFPSPDTIAFGEGGAEALRITSTGQLQAISASDVRLTLGSTGTVGTNDSNHIRADGATLKFMNASGGVTLFENNGTERFRITNNGVTFNGDTAAANALDDYEEGTWTPALGGSATATYTSRTGTYTKIGNRVILFFEIRLATLSGSGNTWLTGNPFTPSGDDGDTGVVAITSGGSGAASSFCMVFSGDTNIYTYTQGSTVRSNWQVSILTGSAIFSGTVVYKTA
jgi:hypothetical protein